MHSVSAYFLTADKAIITKLDQNTKQIELYTKEYYDKCKIRGQSVRGLGHVTYFYILGPLQYLWNG